DEFHLRARGDDLWLDVPAPDQVGRLGSVFSGRALRFEIACALGRQRLVERNATAGNVVAYLAAVLDLDGQFFRFDPRCQFQGRGPDHRARVLLDVGFEYVAVVPFRLHVGNEVTNLVFL